MSDPLLTDLERDAIHAAGRLWAVLCRIVGDDVSRSSDLAELASHIHGIQHAVMAQAAARAYPDDFRLLGDVRQSTVGYLHVSEGAS